MASTRAQDASDHPAGQALDDRDLQGARQGVPGNRHFNNAIAVYELMLDKWPLDPGAPDAQMGLVHAYEELVKITSVGEARSKYEKAVITARTGLVKYTDGHKWYDANKENPTALAHADQLVRGGIKEAAQQHTVAARGAEQRGKDKLHAGDVRNAVLEFDLARKEYEVAAGAWYGTLAQDQGEGPDAYESKYFYAESLYYAVGVQAVLHRLDPGRYRNADEEAIDDPKKDSDASGSGSVVSQPTRVNMMEEARNAAKAVRDSDEDDSDLADSAAFIVGLADIKLDIAVPVKHGDQPRQEGAKGQEQVIEEPIPDALTQAINARDEYRRTVPPALDTRNLSVEYEFEAGKWLYQYGHFKEATERLEPIWKTHCPPGQPPKDEYAYGAWSLLLDMANRKRDAQRAGELATAEQAHSCAVSVAQKENSANQTRKVMEVKHYVEAGGYYEAAKKENDPAKRKKLYEKAAGAYDEALKAAPDNDFAPEAAMNGADSYKQIGDSDDAVRLYNTFIDKYGSDQILDYLKNGGVDPKDPKGGRQAAQPDKYKERLRFLYDALDSLAFTNFQFFAYGRAAASYERIARNARFDESVKFDGPKAGAPQDSGIQKRQSAANRAMLLYGNLRDRKGVEGMYSLLSSDPRIKLSGDKLVEAEFLVRNFDYGSWNPNAPDTGANAAARSAAQAQLTRFYQQYQGRADGARYVVEAAYKVGKMMKAAGDGGYHTWFKNTVEAYKHLSSDDAKKPPYNAYAAEAEFTQVDEDVHKDWDFATNHHRYTGKVVDVKKKFDAEVAEADSKWKPRLDAVQKYLSPEWTAAAMARTGSILRLSPPGPRLREPRALHARGREDPAATRGRRRVRQSERLSGQGRRRLAQRQGPRPRRHEPAARHLLRLGRVRRPRGEREERHGARGRQPPRLLHDLLHQQGRRHEEVRGERERPVRREQEARLHAGDVPPVARRRDVASGRERRTRAPAAKGGPMTRAGRGGVVLALVASLGALAPLACGGTTSQCRRRATRAPPARGIRRRRRRRRRRATPPRRRSARSSGRRPRRPRPRVSLATPSPPTRTATKRSSPAISRPRSRASATRRPRRRAALRLTSRWGRCSIASAIHRVHSRSTRRPSTRTRARRRAWARTRCPSPHLAGRRKQSPSCPISTKETPSSSASRSTWPSSSR